MYDVSKAYKESMKSSLRERGYIKLLFGLINQKAQSGASVCSSDLAYYSTDNIFSENSSDIPDYATLEENFTRVDGSMFLLPRETDRETLYDTGLISGSLVSDTGYELTVNFDTTVSLKGLTIDFGDNYPVDFDVQGENGDPVKFRDNDKSEWSAEETFNDTTYINLTVYKMKSGKSRLRIRRVLFGYGLVYGNESVMDSSLETYVSPVSEDVPQIDFSVTLKNYDKYFNADNPDSAINYLETGQEMDIMYGYQLPDSEEIEWIQGQHLLCSEWESDDSSATIRCQDVFRNMDAEFYKGVYTNVGKSFYDLAVRVLTYAGITDFFIDPRLKKLYTKLPIPRVTCKEALQIIANACRCTLSQSRTGAVQIKPGFVPKVTASANSGTSFSNAANIIGNTQKVEYAALSQNYTPVDGSMYFLPKSGAAALVTGFVSQAISGEDCTFDTNPVVTVSSEAIRSSIGLVLTFGSALPAAFTVYAYRDGTLIDTVEAGQDEIEKTTVVSHVFTDFDTIKIEFTKTAKPYNRIVLNDLVLGGANDFTMERIDMTSSPTAAKLEKTKEIVVSYYGYGVSVTEESIVSEEVSVSVGDVMTFYTDEPIYSITSCSTGASVTEFGCWFVTVKFNVEGNYSLSVSGCKYRQTQKNVTKTLGTDGKTVTWGNPLVDDKDSAEALAQWLADYYAAEIEYTYSTRGNPEIDVLDVIYQENDFADKMQVLVTNHTVNFKQSFSGNVTALRIED